MALCSHGGNRSTQAVDQLRIVVRGLAGVGIPTQVCTAAQDYDNTASGACELSSRPILARVAKLAVELTLFATCLRPARAWGMGISLSQGLDCVRRADTPAEDANELVPVPSSP